jgi:hypothetical protein
LPKKLWQEKRSMGKVRRSREALRDILGMVRILGCTQMYLI